jgi:hypothetical protein
MEDTKMKMRLRVFLLVCLLLPMTLTLSAHVSANPGVIDPGYTRALPNGETLESIIIDGPPTPPPDAIRPMVTLANPHQNANLSLITSVPAFNWSFGCAATSAAMIAGYYDRNGYPNMYAGSTHDGLMPMDNSYWSDWVDGNGDTRHRCPLSATQNGLDGRTSRGHVDDYWVAYGSSAADPYDTNGWTEHTYEDCTGDYMKTNQTTKYGLSDGATRFYSYLSANPLTCTDMESMTVSTDTLASDVDGTYGFKLFYESRGYTVTDCYYQKSDNEYTGGFSFADFKAEIDAGHPVMVHLTGHTIVGFGYDDATDEIYLYDTWDYDAHTMSWGGSYSGMDLVGVSIVHLDTYGYRSVQTGNWSASSTWNTGVPGTSDDVTIQSGHTVTATNDVGVQNLTIEYDGTLIIPDGVTVTVEGILSNNGTLQQTQNVPAGSTTEFLHITDSAGTTDKYHGLDITPDSTSLGSTTVAIQGNHTGGCTTVRNDPLLYRCFEITPTSQESATLKFWYDEDERNDQTANDLVVWHHDGGTNWSQTGTYSYSESDIDCQSEDGRACWVEAAGISSYSVFDIGSDGSAPTATMLTTLERVYSPVRDERILLGMGIIAGAILTLRVTESREEKYDDPV